MKRIGAIPCPHCGKTLAEDFTYANELLKSEQDRVKIFISGYSDYNLCNERNRVREEIADRMYRVEGLSPEKIEEILQGSFDIGYELLAEDILDIKSVKDERDFEIQINTILSQNSEKRAREALGNRKDSDKLYYMTKGVEASKNDLGDLLSH